MLKRFILLAALSVCPPSMGWATPIYVWKDKSGATRFTNREPPPGVTAQVWEGKKAGFSVFKVSARPVAGRKLYRNVYNEMIGEASASHGLPQSLIKAVIHAESAFNPKAVSPKGARGLMQIMPQTGAELGLINFFDPLENIRAGSKYLAFLLEKFNGNLVLAVAAYNAGPGAVEEYKGIPPYAETRSYVRRVLDLKKKYERNA